MILGDLIKKYREEKNISMREFSSLCGLSHTYISALEKKYDIRTGKLIAPTLESVKLIAKAMNISIDDLLKVLDDEQEFKVNEEQKKFYKCPVYGQIPAGQPNWAEECLDGYIPLDPNLMGIIDPEECFFLKVNGESMNKIIANGSYALIRKQSSVENGDIAVVLVNGDEATLKRFTQNENIVVLSPNSSETEFEPLIIDTSKTNVKILGKYIGKFEIN